MRGAVRLAASAQGFKAQSSASFGMAIASLSLVSWLPVLVGVITRPALGWPAAIVLALVVEMETRRFRTSLLVAALFVSSALVPSGLVTDATHYMPVAVTGGALAVRIALEIRQSRRLTPPIAPPVLVLVGLYLAWATVSTVFAIDHRVSLTYLLGMLAMCALAFWAVPLMLGTRRDAEGLLATLGVIGVAVAFSVYVVSAVGAISLFGRSVGAHEVGDLTLLGHPTGIYFARSGGVYLAPLEPSILMVVGVVGLIGLASRLAGRDLVLARLGIGVMVPAIVVTLDRSAWLAALVAAGIYAALAVAVRAAPATAAAVCAFFAVLFLAVMTNTVGVNAVVSCATPCGQTVAGPPAAGADEVALRGGTGLSGRQYLWEASARAISARPVFGYGPGNDVTAIQRFLPEPGRYLHGLTSHDTWLRTAVEMGIPGLVLLIGVFAATAWMFIRRPRTISELPDPIHLALGASVIGLLPAMTFETFLLGGVTFSSLYLASAMGLMLAPLRQAEATDARDRRSPQPGSIRSGRRVRPTSG